MANHDHADNIGTHPAFSNDPETRLQARVEAAYRRLKVAEQQFAEAVELRDVFVANKATKGTS